MDLVDLSVIKVVDTKMLFKLIKEKENTSVFSSNTLVIINNNKGGFKL